MQDFPSYYSTKRQGISEYFGIYRNLSEFIGKDGKKAMTAKEYLQQAYYSEMAVNDGIRELDKLKRFMDSEGGSVRPR